jgi:hypothetical protein
MNLYNNFVGCVSHPQQTGYDACWKVGKMSVKKFRKKPVEIEAIRLESNASSIKKVLEFMGQEVNTKTEVASDKFYDYCTNSYKYGGIDIKTLEGKHKASFADMIIKGVNGEFYPCKPDIFEKTYEEVV